MTRKIKDPFLKVVLAVLPVLGSCLDVRGALATGLAGMGVFWMTGLFFQAAGRGFPGRFLKTAFVLWLAVLAHTGWALFHLSPWWAISLYLLAPPALLDRDSDKPGRGEIFWLGFGFAVLTVSLGLGHEVLGRQLAIRIFQKPAGSLLLLSLLAVFWQNQPAREREEDHA